MIGSSERKGKGLGWVPGWFIFVCTNKNKPACHSPFPSLSERYPHHCKQTYTSEIHKPVEVGGPVSPVVLLWTSACQHFQTACCLKTHFWKPCHTSYSVRYNYPVTGMLTNGLYSQWINSQDFNQLKLQQEDSTCIFVAGKTCSMWYNILGFHWCHMTTCHTTDTL